MLKRKVPLWIAIPMIVAIGAFLYAFDSRKAEAASTKPAKVWSNEECLSCHTNKKVLAQMQSKRGDNTYCQAAYDNLVKLQGTDSKPAYGTK